MGQYHTAKMLMLVLYQTVDNWLLSAAVDCDIIACRSQMLLVYLNKKAKHLVRLNDEDRHM